ncbi:serine/threonine-protein kinase [Puerhibacterium puerhi]|uniref:serine/threonine-protein kinase n=1 Tax=Puerhibacterium puerhi TaxID=2692623 RepID=UPI001356E13C|nr:serine/threonine-protein kinase [Puerhibacterium puerhi]
MTAPRVLLGGRYRLGRVIASGGMGVVWEAWDERLGRPVAIKQLRPVAGVPAEEAELAKRRAVREARITARLHHPHAVPAFDAVEHEGQPCLVMPYLPSTPLSAVLEEHGTLPLGQAARIAAEVASALAAAHELGIVHRDVKPGNVLITPDGAAHISDFGISHAMGDPTLTGSGTFHGTPAYLAPEVALGRAATFASDVFSLGATLYAMLEGEPPFGTEPNPLALLHKAAAGQVRAPSQAGPLTPLLRAMLSREPSARPAMAEVATRLARVGSEGPRTERPQPVPVVVTPDPVPGPGVVPAARPAPVVDPSPAALAPAGGGAGTGGPPTRRRPRVPVLLAGVLVVAALFLATGELTGWFGSDAGEPLSTGRATSATTASPETSPEASPEASPGTSPGGASHDAGSPAATPGAAGPQGQTATEPPATQGPEAGDEEPAPGSEDQDPEAGQQGQGDEQQDGTQGRGGGEPDAAAPDRASRLASAVTGYYALMPTDTDDAWALMTGDYRQNHAGGRAAYERFWSRVAEVSVSDVQPAPPDRAEATLTYVFRDGRVVVERTAYRFADEGGRLRIAATEVLSSRGA